MVVSGVGITLCGLVAVSPVLVVWVARLAVGVTGNLAVGVAARYVMSAAARYSRSVTGLVSLIFVSGVLLSFFPLLADAASGGYRDLSKVTNDERTFVTTLVAGTQQAQLDSLRSSDGIDGVAVLRQVPVRPEGEPQLDKEGYALLIVDCRDMSQTLGEEEARCESGLSLFSSDAFPSAVQPIAPIPDDTGSSVAFADVGSAIRVPTGLNESRVLGALADATGLYAAVAMSVEEVPNAVVRELDQFQGVVVIEATEAADRESTRTAIIDAIGGGNVLTVEERLEIAEKTTRDFRDLTLAGFLCAVGVGVAGLLIATFDHMKTRRAAIWDLKVIGAPRRLLVGAQFCQAALLAVPMMLLAMLCGIVAASSFVGLADTPPPIPRSRWLLLVRCWRQ